MSTLVLGGGFAGLSAAIHLAVAGQEVTLIEAQPYLGGKAGRLVRDGYSFDTGPTVFTLPHVLADLFAAAGEMLPFTYTLLEPLCRYIYPSGRVLDVYQDQERTLEGLEPHEARVYRRLLHEARRLYEGAAPRFVYAQAPGPMQLLRYALRHGPRAHPTRTLVALLEHHGASADLKQFFLRFATYFGADPYRAPAILHNIAWVEQGLGVYYPDGGIGQVIQELVKLAQRLGVTLQTNERAERLERSGGNLTTVITDKSIYTPKAVISTLDIVRTHHLLGRTSKLERAEPSLSGLVILIGVEGRVGSFAHHTIIFPEDYAQEFKAIRQGIMPRAPTLYASVGSRTDPKQAPDGCDNLFLMANAPALNKEGRGPTEADYHAFAEHYLTRLERFGLTPRQVAFMEVRSPHALAALAHRGSIYGHAPHSLLGTLRPRQTVSGIRNLVLAGGTVHPGGGIPLALLSGKHAAQQIIGPFRMR